MPEGPELHIAARFINNTAERYRFGGAVEKSEVSTKNPAVTWLAKEYLIRGETRGKELKIFLTDANNPKSSTHLLLRFGMSGCFKLAKASDLPKHAHLRFFTIGASPKMALCFVDYRRFGRWELEGDWGKDRGPDPIFEYEAFRANILENLDKPAFNRPICEAMLNQKYFNGIGNYLRAEILFRCRVKPFDEARKVLKEISERSVKLEGPDPLELCKIVPKEVLALEAGKSYDADESQKSQDTFSEWLQCYYVEGMNNLEDANGRTMWFQGSPGDMAPKVKKVKGRKGKKGTQIPQSGKEESEVKKEQKEPKIKKPPVKSENEANARGKKQNKKGKKETKACKEIKIESNNSKIVKNEPEEANEEESVTSRKRSTKSDQINLKRPRKTASRRASADADFKRFF